MEAGRSSIYHTLMLSRIGVALLSGFSLLALAMYLRQTCALERHRQEQQHLAQAERDRLEVEVAQRTAQLTELARHLQTAREDERGRLARELHDELGALLTAAKLDAARIKSRLAGTPPEARERLEPPGPNAQQRHRAEAPHHRRPAALDAGQPGPGGRAGDPGARVRRRSGIEVHTRLEPVALEADAELMVYRLVQEALTNIAKYAKAKQVWVGWPCGDQVHVSVRDDGVGFDAAARRPRPTGWWACAFGSRPKAAACRAIRARARHADPCDAAGVAATTIAA